MCSCYGRWKTGRSMQIQREQEQHRLLLHFTKDMVRDLVGEPAKRQAVTNADKTISSIKRHMGTDYRVTIDDKKYSPQEISAMILQKLKADAEGYLR